MPVHTSAISGSSGFAVLTDTMVNASKGGSFTGNSSSVNNDINLGSYYNALLYGPITIDSGASFTIGANSNVKIKDFDDV